MRFYSLYRIRWHLRPGSSWIAGPFYNSTKKISVRFAMNAVTGVQSSFYWVNHTFRTLGTLVSQWYFRKCSSNSQSTTFNFTKLPNRIQIRVQPILTTSRIHFSLKSWENALFELGVKGLKGKLRTLTAIPACLLMAHLDDRHVIEDNLDWLFPLVVIWRPGIAQRWFGCFFSLLQAWGGIWNRK